MKIVFVSNLFPDATEPFRGLDNAVLLQHLSKKCEICVVAPRPTLPWKKLSRSPRPTDEKFRPVYPRALYVPKIGSAVNHLLFTGALRQPLRRFRDTFPFEVILCSWMYPDGCAVARVADEFRVPFVLVAQGSDVHAHLQMAFRRRLICQAVTRASVTITRSRKLAELLAKAGAPDEKLHPIYNGVDLETFSPGDRNAARKELSLPPDSKIILFVGNFLPVKNPLLLVDAHIELRRRKPAQNVRLVMLGDGPLRDEIWLRANQHGFAGAVHMLGRKPPAQVARFMQAANALCLSSNNEGVPNVVLEAFACGLPVVSTRVGGIPEVLTETFLGQLVEKGDRAELVSALEATLTEQTDVEKIRNHAMQFSWENAATKYLALLKQAAGKCA